MKKIIATGLLTSITFFCFAQDTANIINAKEVERIEKTLSSDEMRGRKAFSPDIERAADFIANEFRSIGLQTWNNSGNYRQEFSMVTPKFISASAVLDGVAAEQKSVIVVTVQPNLKLNETTGFEKVKIKAGANLFSEASEYVHAGKKLCSAGRYQFFKKLFPPGGL